MSQAAVTDLPGFANCLKLQCTTADTSIASNELGIIMQRIEGQDLQQLKKGTSSAESVTVSFYVKGNAAATYTAELNDGGNDRQISKTFSVTTSWNRVSLTYPGDTSGTIDDDNTAGLELNIWIHAGSNFTSGTLSTTWTSTTNANRVSSSATSFFDSTSRTLEITGLQMEVGEQATPFEHRSFGDELARCQRYYYRRTNVSDSFNEYSNSVFAYATTDIQGGAQHPVQMRADPSLTFDGVLKVSTGSGTVTSSSGFSKTNYSTKDFMGFYTGGGPFTGLTQHRAYMLFGDTNDYMEVDAEL